MAPSSLKPLVEALLFVSDSAVSLVRLLSACSDEGVTESELREAVGELNADYSRTGRSFRIREIAGGFKFAVQKEFADRIRSFQNERPVKLSPSALETLSIIAYRQPVTRAGIEEVRGVDSGGVLKTLLERRLVRIAGRSDGLGKPLLYGTTDVFLEHFGLVSLRELPRLEELPEVAQKDQNGAHSAQQVSVTGRGGLAPTV